MWNKTLASRVLRESSADRRRILSDWRIQIYARRVAHAENLPLPDLKESEAIRDELIRRGDVTPIEGVAKVYKVDTAYANLLEISEEQVIQEANPWAAFGFLTAMVYHGLTDLVPSAVYAIQFKEGEHLARLPLGTTPEDWHEVRRTSARQPRKVEEAPVNWTEIKGEWEFGVAVGYSLGLPIYVTDVERTLLDGLRMPGKCGGIAKVFHAWRAADGMDVGRLIEYADRFDLQVLRQRVGYLLEKLDRGDPRLDAWRDRLQRGGSVKLVASGEYSETYSPRWNLSLNVPPSVLAIIE